MAAAHRRYGRRGHVTLDWALVAVTLMAVAVLAGTVIRTGHPASVAQFGAQVGGLRALSETETLLVFEDAGTATPGWSGGRRNADHVGLGAIWIAEPADGTLERRLDLPDGTRRAVLSFDLIAIDDWALQGLAVSVDGTEVLQHRFTSRPGLDLPAPERPDVDGIAVRSRLEPARDLGFAQGGPELAEQRLRVEIALRASPGPVALRIAPVPAMDGGDTGAPQWAVDNLMVIVEREPDTAE